MYKSYDVIDDEDPEIKDEDKDFFRRAVARLVSKNKDGDAPLSLLCRTK